MVVLLPTDKQPAGDLTIKEISRSKSGYSLRRTRARAETREARDSPPPAVKKRTAAASARAGRAEKKIKQDNAEESTAAAAVGGNHDESAVVTVEKSAYAKVRETLRKFNRYYLNFIQAEESRFAKRDADLKALKLSKSKSKNDNTAEDRAKKAQKRPDLKATAEVCPNSSK